MFDVQGLAVLPEIASLRVLGDGWIELTWTSVDGAWYSVRAAESLHGGGFTNLIATGIWAQPPTNFGTFYFPAGGKPLFFQIHVIDQQ